MKTEQLQIRISPEIKASIRKKARAAGMDMSEWVLLALFPPVTCEFQNLCSEIAKQAETIDRFLAFATLSDFLERLSSDELALAITDQPESKLGEFAFNYIAAMVELACPQDKANFSLGDLTYSGPTI